MVARTLVCTCMISTGKWSPTFGATQLKPTHRHLSQLRLVCFLLLGAMCGCDARTDIVDEARTLRMGNLVEPETLDPQRASGIAENRIISELLMGLMAEDPQGRPIPGMAKEWTTSSDGLVWTFTLRDAQWSDGVPITAHDFVYAWQRMLMAKSASEYVSLLYFIKGARNLNEGRTSDLSQLGVKAFNDKTLIVTLEHPTPYLLGLLTHYSVFPIPKHVVEKYGADWVKPEHYVGNGPFQLVEWTPNKVVHVARNPKFWDQENVCLNEIYFYPTSNEAEAEDNVRTGKFDVNPSFVGSKLQQVTEKLPGYARVHGYTSVSFAAFNTRRAPFNDARVREALSISVERERVTKEIFGSGQQPAYSLVPPGVANYETGIAALDFKNEPLAARQARAKALLEAAGYGPAKPLIVTFAYRNVDDNPRMASAFQQDWSKIAPWVRVEIEGQDVQTTYANLDSGNFEFTETGWTADFNDAKNFNFLFETSNKGLNYGKYSNPEFDALMASADNEKDLNKRKLFMQDAEAILLADHALMPLWFETSRNLVNPRITGWVDNAVDIHRARYLCTTDVTQEGQ
jgi:oligopeptide transport system substrate-binding protein